MVENSLDFDTWKTQLNLAEGEADENDVQRLWKDCFRATTNNCIHEYEKGTCPDNTRLAGGCMIGKRCLEIFLLCGPILSVWNHIQEIIHKYDKNASIQVVRLKTSKGKRLVGLLIPNNCVEGLGEGLAKLERNRPKIRGPKRKYHRRESNIPGGDLNSAQTESEIERMAAEMFQEEGNEDETNVGNGEHHDGEHSGGEHERDNGERSSGSEEEQDLDEDELERLAQQVIMENGFTF